MTNTIAQATEVAEAQTRNTLGTCQLNVHRWFDVPSVGDVDHDGDADAVDGWESEPKAYRFPGLRNPDFAGPLAFHGGRLGFGHRAFLMKPGHIRSTDMSNNHYQGGVTSTVVAETTSAAIAIIERSMNVVYTGISKTIDGRLIPDFAEIPNKPAAPQTRGARVDLSLRKLRVAQAKAKNPARKAAIAAAIKALLAIPTHDRKN